MTITTTRVQVVPMHGKFRVMESSETRLDGRVIISGVAELGEYATEAEATAALERGR